MKTDWRENPSDIDEEMHLADQAIRYTLPHLFRPEIMERLRSLHAAAIRAAMRRQDRKRLAELAEWKGRADECVDLMYEVRAAVFGKGWMHPK